MRPAATGDFMQSFTAGSFAGFRKELSADYRGDTGTGRRGDTEKKDNALPADSSSRPVASSRERKTSPQRHETPRYTIKSGNQTSEIRYQRASPSDI